jgi:hypothetical protein
MLEWLYLPRVSHPYIENSGLFLLFCYRFHEHIQGGYIQYSVVHGWTEF